MIHWTPLGSHPSVDQKRKEIVQVLIVYSVLSLIIQIWRMFDTTHRPSGTYWVILGIYAALKGYQNREDRRKATWLLVLSLPAIMFGIFRLFFSKP